MTEHKPLTEHEVSRCGNITDYEDAVRSAVMGFDNLLTLMRKNNVLWSHSPDEVHTLIEDGLREWFSVFFDDDEEASQ